MGALNETLWKFRKHFIQVGFTYMEEPSFRNQQQPFWHFHSMKLEIGAMPTLEGRCISSKSHPKTTSHMAKSRIYLEDFWPQRNGNPHCCRWVISYLPSPVAPLGVPGAREAWEINLEHNTICGAKLTIGEQLGALGPHEKPTHKDIMYCSCKLNTWQFRIQVCWRLRVSLEIPLFVNHIEDIKGAIW